jgi:site-specific DNA-methyltransferase (adenine-specific)
MLELNKTHNMDCLDGMRLLDDNCIDLTVTSPPYDNLRKYNGYSFDFENIAKELYRVTKDGGVVVWVVNDKTDKGSETLTSFRQALYFKEIGFNYTALDLKGYRTGSMNEVLGKE